MCKQDSLWVSPLIGKSRRPSISWQRAPTRPLSATKVADVNSLTPYNFSLWPQKNKALASFVLNKDHSPTGAQLAEVQGKGRLSFSGAFFWGWSWKGVHQSTYLHVATLPRINIMVQGCVCLNLGRKWMAPRYVWPRELSERTADRWVGKEARNHQRCWGVQGQ